MQARTRWTHSDVWSQLATMPECSLNIADRQSAKNRWNCDRWAMCNTTCCIDSGHGVIHHQGVSDGSNRAHPLWHSHSARTEMFFVDVYVIQQDNTQLSCAYPEFPAQQTLCTMQGRGIRKPTQWVVGIPCSTPRSTEGWDLSMQSLRDYWHWLKMRGQKRPYSWVWVGMLRNVILVQ